MKDRQTVTRDLEDFQARLKELEIRYEQYFAGVEKREPYRERKDLSRQLRQYNPLLITQTDLKFRYHSLTARLVSYSNYWDRILRLIDEGKYHRHLTKAAKTSTAPKPSPASAASEAEHLHQQLAKAREQCGLPGAVPSPAKVADYLAVQREKIRQKFGDRPVEFQIDISAGKPRIKVRLKQ